MIEVGDVVRVREWPDTKGRRYMVVKEEPGHGGIRTLWLRQVVAGKVLVSTRYVPEDRCEKVRSEPR
jgi:hypothetical protein